MDGDMMILKLGGSVITDKTKPFSPLTAVIERVAREVAEAKPSQLVIVHGGGSFGHPVAKKYDITSGFREGKQILGFAKTRQAMVALNKLIVDALISNGVNAVSLQPSAFITTRNGRIDTLNTEVLRRMLNLKLTPVLYGDAVVDLERGFTILSGDQLAAKLAVLLKAKKIILAVDVDGLFTADPKRFPNSKLVRTVKLGELPRFLREEAGTEPVTDVTGSMAGKLREMTPALKENVGVMLVNGLKAGRVFRALHGGNVRGTVLEP